jgi:hypothetical protein
MGFGHAFAAADESDQALGMTTENNSPCLLDSCEQKPIMCVERATRLLCCFLCFTVELARVCVSFVSFVSPVQVPIALHCACTLVHICL